MLQSVLQERVRGNKALSLTGAIGVNTHLWSYEQQDFRRVIKADDAYMLVTGTGVYES